MATTTQDLELMQRMVAAPPHDNSALRARLGGQVIVQRSIEAELRAAMAERTNDVVIDVRDAGDRWS
jgi:hypothetical protein